MAYYNPNYFNQNTIPYMASPLSLSPQLQPRIDPQQFASVAATLDDGSLNQLINMAKMRGISDQDIQTGINFINQYRKK